MTTLKAYKAFDENLQCRGFQYEFGKKYTHDGDVEVCRSGFHAVLNPLDMWDYYPIVGSRYGTVTLSGEVKTHDEDTKVVGGEITPDQEISLADVIRDGTNYLIDNASDDASGDSAKIGSSGDSAQIGSSGDSAKIGSSGDSAQIDASGARAVIASAGVAARVRATNGAWIAVAEYDKDGNCVGFATGCIGKDGLKPSVWYVAKGGKLVEDQE